MAAILHRGTKCIFIDTGSRNNCTLLKVQHFRWVMEQPLKESAHFVDLEKQKLHLSFFRVQVG